MNSEATTFPKEFLGRIRFPWNFWAWLRRYPQGAAVWFYPDMSEKEQKSSFTGHVVVHVNPELGSNYLVDGMYDFQQGTISFKDDKGNVTFDGKIDQTGPRLRGIIKVSDMRDPHPIEFAPWLES